MTAQRFLAVLTPMGLRTATVEDVRDAIVAATVGASTATARQYTLRIKSLLGYGHELGYMPFNAGGAHQGAKRRRQPRGKPGQADHDPRRGGVTDPCCALQARSHSDRGCVCRRLARQRYRQPDVGGCAAPRERPGAALHPG